MLIMNSKESEMKGRREERNVLDELLDNQEDDDLDVELNRGFKKSRNIKIFKVASDMESGKRDGIFKNVNGNRKRALPREDSSCSEYSAHSVSQCSCEDHSGNSRTPSRSPSPPNSDARSQCSYQSFTRSPSLKIKIHKNSNSRSVKSLKSPPKSYEVIDRKRTKYGTKDIPPKKRVSSKIRDYESLLKYFFKDSCYFVMKSNNAENVLISKREGVWATPLANEIKLKSAFKEFRNVILIFSVKESGKFQGFARLSSEANYNCEPVNWVLPPGVSSCPFGGLFYVDWICHHELSFTETSHLYNPFNEGKPVKIARDGQEIDPRIGEQLCRLFPSDNSIDLIPLLKRMKKQTKNRPKKRHSRGPFMEFDKEIAPSTPSSRNDYHIRSHSSSNSHLTSIRKRLGHHANDTRSSSNCYDRQDSERILTNDRYRRDNIFEGGSYYHHRSNSSYNSSIKNDNFYESYRREHSRQHSSHRSIYGRRDSRF